MFFSTYLLVVGGACYTDIHAQWQLNQFDLNQDGLFSSNEITLAQKAAVKDVVSDTARNFSFITGFIFSGIIASMVYLCGRTFEQKVKS